MNVLESLEDLISKKAAGFASAIRAVATGASTEEEIRIAVEKQLGFLQREAGISLEGRHEFTVASGRVDSVYDRVIIEYKNPRSPSARIGSTADSPATKKLVDQIKSRFADLEAEYKQSPNALLGVGLDGNRILFVRFRDGRWDVQDPAEFTQHSARRFLWSLFNLGRRGKPFAPDYLAADFGAAAPIAQAGVRVFYETITTTDNPKALTFFAQWKLLFAEAGGYDARAEASKIRELAEFYGIAAKTVRAPELLFSVHTYYALFMKLLAAEIVAFFHKLPTPLQKMLQAPTTAHLRREVEDLEAGSIFRHLNITNFLEGDLFAWYTAAWSSDTEKLVRDLVSRLDAYNPGTLSEDANNSRDLLKNLYQDLFPKNVRHDLGEYYTADWLAEYVLNEVRYDGDPDTRVLDPACGSGTFLVMAINRVRRWHEEHEESGVDERDLGRKILTNIIGFDLNPLAVMAARTNYLIAIRDLITDVAHVELPVYLCDSVLTPGEYGGLFGGGLGKSRAIKTAAATFVIPSEIGSSRDHVAKYADELEYGVRNQLSPEDFLERCRREGLPITTESLHVALYRELLKLDKANKNGIWARIIKNSFAPLFVGVVDLVVGNPPWVHWNNLPPAYRDDTRDLWLRYGFFTQKGYKALVPAGPLDLSALFTYVCLDTYLRSNGKLGFVITQTLFKSKGAGEGFRALSLPGEVPARGRRPLRVHRVSDLSGLRPFDAENQTAVVLIQRDAKTAFPVPYLVWSAPSGMRHIPPEASLADVEKLVTVNAMVAQPSNSADPRSPWTTIEPAQAKLDLGTAKGESVYRARSGIHTHGANAIYWVEPVTVPGGKKLYRNVTEGAKRKVPPKTTVLEADLVYPLLRGRDVRRWLVQPRIFILVPHSPKSTKNPIERSEMASRYHQALDYLTSFRATLVKRSMMESLGDGGPFYRLFKIGPYTFAPYKVVYREQSSTLLAAVVGKQKGKLIMPDHKLYFIGVDSEDEAHFICALLNSSLALFLVGGYSLATSRATHVLQHLSIPRWSKDVRIHRELAEASQACHKAALEEDWGSVAGHEERVDTLSAALWKVPAETMANIREAVAKLRAHEHSEHKDDDA